MRRGVDWQVLFVPTIVSTLMGCDSCEKEKPYVPYTVDPSAMVSGAISSDPAESPTMPSIETFSPVVAKRLNGALSVRTAEGTVSAPAGKAIDLWLEADLTADGKPDSVAWLRSTDGLTGELVRFVTTRPGEALSLSTLVSLPPDFAMAPDCKATSDLRQVGPRTVALSIRKICPIGTKNVTTQWVAALVLERNPALRFQLIVDQPPIEKLEISLDALDRDGDGFDDLLVSFQSNGSTAAFEEPKTENAVATLRYFDRPAGLSRDPHEPTSSFLAMAQRLERLAKGNAKDSVAPIARATRQLHLSLCGEGDSRIKIMGQPLQCGSRDAMTRITTAELDAALGSKDILSALGAYERLREQGTGTKELDTIRKRIEKAVPSRSVQAYFLPFGPSVDPSGGTWSPLAFLPDGSLLIRTDNSVMRFDAKLRIALPDPDSGPIAPWSLRVEASGGSTSFEGVEGRDGWLWARWRRGNDTIEALLPFDTSLTKTTARPVAWSSTGLHLLTSLGPVWVSTQGSKVKRTIPEATPGSLGSPRSPDGHQLVHASSLGLVVLDIGNDATLWRAPSLPNGYEKLAGCVISNGATAVACIDSAMTRVFLNESQ